MDFDNKLPEWKNEGVEPSDNLKENGFLVKLKPPADIFNWFWSKVIKAITELQTKLKSHSDNTQNPHKVTKDQVGLENVDNTKDSEKSVKFASEAETGRKVQYPLTIRFKGGDTEGTNKWTFDGSTSRSVNITPDKIEAADKEHEHTLDDVTETSEKKMGRVVNAISTDGVAYTATVDGITELYNGLTITIIPNMLSTSKNTTLNVNGLGAKQLRCSIGGYNFGNSGTIAALDGWLGADSPVTIQYKSKFDNWQTIISRPSVSGLYGTVKEEQGGTGKTNLKDVVVGGSDWAECANHLGLHDCSNKDINTLKSSGYYFGYTNMTNAAFQGICVLEVIPYSNDWVLQRQTRLTDGKTFCRYYSSGSSWSDWFSVFTTLHKPTPADITAGTFSGYVAANKSGQHYGTALLRNSSLASTEKNPTNDGEICWTYK